jgi:hypothetical protein
VYSLAFDRRIKKLHAEFKDCTVMPASLSYLQTLPQTEATAFVISLQKVKEHLSQELAFINTQLQQKTVQLQGINGILADLGSPATEVPVPVSEALVSEALASEAPVSEVPTNGNSSVSRLLDLETPTPASPSSDQETAVSEPVRSQRGKKPSSQSKTPAKAKRGATKPASKSKSSARSSEPNALKPFLQVAFQNQPLNESIAQVLSNAAEPLSTDELMVELYEGLSSEDYQRAKRSLTNILSTGRSKGKWQSTGRGLYASNAT